MGRTHRPRPHPTRATPLAVAGAAATIFGVSMGIVALLTWTSYRGLHDARIATLAARADADLGVAASRMERTYAEIAGDVAVTAAAPSIRAAASGDAEARADATSYLLRVVQTYGRYARIRLVDADGREALHVVRGNGDPLAVPPSTTPDPELAARLAGAFAGPHDRIFVVDLTTPTTDALHGDDAVALIGFALHVAPTPDVAPHALLVEFDATDLLRRTFAALTRTVDGAQAIVLRSGHVLWAPPAPGAAWSEAVPPGGPHPLLARHPGAAAILAGDATTVRDAQGLLVARTVEPSHTENGRFHRPGGTAPERWTLIRHVPTPVLAALDPLRDASQRRILVAVAAVLAALSLALGATQERVRADRRRFRDDALHDALTGLGNRRACDEALARERARAERHDTPLAVAALDLDHFKAINDRHGHPAGDAVLRAFADLAQAHLRDTDELFRVGGEEFVALLPTTSEDDAHAVLERLRDVVATTPIPLPEGATTPLTTSVGLAVLQPGTGTPGDPLAAADAALYEAKRAGRDRIVVAGG